MSLILLAIAVGFISACLSDLTKAVAPEIVQWIAECKHTFTMLKTVLEKKNSPDIHTAD
jgi:hypothetical protein